MRVAILSMFQNSMGYLNRYMMQVYKLQAEAPHHFDLVLGEGDSTDEEQTWNKLNERFPGCVHKCVHGGQVFGSVDTTQRWVQLSIAWNQLLPHVLPYHDAALYIEADLYWEPSTIIKLLDRLKEVDAITGLCTWDNHPERQPLCGCKSPDLMHLYDWWGYRAVGQKFTVCYPYSPIFLTKSTNGLFPIDSCGSFLAMKGQTARECRFDPPQEGLCGFCQNMKAHGYQLWCDPKLRVTHP
jgi:hypothetical protein